MIVYMATNIKNGKKYVGKTRFSLEKRKKQHERNAKYGRSGHFYNAIRKYGENSFMWNILESDVESSELLNELEFHYIKQYNTYYYGYNLTLGGDGMSFSKGYKWEKIYGVEKSNKMKKLASNKLKGRKKPLSMAKKLSESQSGVNNTMYGKGWKISGANNGMYGRTKEKNPFWNKKHTEESKRKISESSKKWWSNLSDDELLEYKSKMSEALKGRVFSNETLKKLSETNKGKNNPMYGKTPWNKGKIFEPQTKKERLKHSKYKWHIYDVINNKEYNIIDLKSWCEDNNINRTNIYRKANTNKLFDKKYLITRKEL